MGVYNHHYGHNKTVNEVPDDLKTHSRRINDSSQQKSDLTQNILRNPENRKKRSFKERRKRRSLGKEKEAESPANTTDPESSMMKSGPGCIQGYNGQEIVNQDGYILVPFLRNLPLITDCFNPAMRDWKKLLN